jgi:hypothetical protein
LIRQSRCTSPSQTENKDRDARDHVVAKIFVAVVREGIVRIDEYFSLGRREGKSLAAEDE